jgi:hypothetical protein
MAMSDSDLITEEDLPDEVREAIGSAPDLGPVAPPSLQKLEGGVVDYDALRRIVRETNPLESEGTPAHIDFAKRTWLKALIWECKGDLPTIARYWDRSSEKTLRNLIKSLGLWDDLERARKRS